MKGETGGAERPDVLTRLRELADHLLAQSNGEPNGHVGTALQAHAVILELRAEIAQPRDAA